MTRKVRFLDENDEPAQLDGPSEAAPLLVLSKHDGDWKIDVLHNTPVLPPSG